MSTTDKIGDSTSSGPVSGGRGGVSRVERRMVRENVGQRENVHMVVRDGYRLLPVFHRYTVDVRLRQFRIARRAKDGTPLGVEFVSFDDPEGDALLVKYLRWCSPEGTQRQPTLRVARERTAHLMNSPRER